MIHLYNKYGTKLWIIKISENKIYLFRVSFWESLKLVFAYELRFGRGFYKKIERLSFEESLIRFHPFYILSDEAKICIRRNTWKMTKVVFEGKDFHVKAYKEDKLYALEDILQQMNFRNLMIKEN